MEKWLIPGMGERRYKIGLKYIFMPESKEMFKGS